MSATTGAITTTGAATTGTFFADTGLPAFLWATTAGDAIAATLVADGTTTAEGFLADAGGLPAFLGATTAATVVVVVFCSCFFDGKAETTFLEIPAGLPTFLGAAGAGAGAGATMGFDTEAELAEGLPAFLG